jgi:uncharacterized protein YqhQ
VAGGAEGRAPIGGQAVHEGVEMRTPRVWAVAVRRPDGRITTEVEEKESVAVQRRWLRLPILRGVVALGESLSIGFRALGLSARLSASDDDDAEEEPIGRGAIIFSFIIAIGFALALFKVTPGVLAKLLDIEPNWLFLIVEGLIRIGIFLGYLIILSFIPDLRRVFQYHAAEHKAINALEAGEELTPEKVQRYSLIHLRCGTAFLLWVMVVAILVFAFVGKVDSWLWLILSRILLLPLIAGIAYEVIRLAARFGTNPVVHLVLLPGLWLQRLTTREPTNDQVEVSIASLQAALARDDELRAARTKPQGEVEVMA